MTSETFQVSVVIPTYNRADLLVETLKSVFSQTVAPCEVVVVDDGSTDETEAVMSSWSDRLRYVRQENQGVAVARNYGLRLARGEWVAYLDSDDLWAPEKIQRDQETHERHPTAQVLYGGSRRMSPGHVGRALLPPDASDRFLEALAMRNTLSVGGVTVRRDVLAETPGFLEDAVLGPSADWELWVRLAARYEFACTHVATLLVREHPDNMMHNPARMEAAMTMAVERFLADPIAGPRLADIAERVRSRAQLYAAIGYYGCGDTESARVRLGRARQQHGSVIFQPMWIYTAARSLLGDRWSSRLRRFKQSIVARVG